jgi:hypothetical protein
MASTGYGNTVYVWGVRINTQEAGELATQLGATQAAQRLAKVAPSRMVAPALGLGSGLSLGLAFLNIDRQSGELNELGMAAYLSGIGTGLAALFTLGLPERHLRLGVQSFNQHYAAQSINSAWKSKADSTLRSFLGLAPAAAPSQHRFHRLISGIVVLDGQTMSTLRAAQICRFHGMEEAANHLKEASDLEKRYNYFQNSQLGTLIEMGRMMQHRRLIDAANFAIDEYNRSLNPSVSP